MRKLMVLAVMLAMVLVSAAPAMANTLAVGGDVGIGFGNNSFGNNSFGNSGFGNSGFDDGATATGGDLGFADSDQAQLAFAVQQSSGNTGAASGTAQSLGIFQGQFNAGFDGARTTTGS